MRVVCKNILGNGIVPVEELRTTSNLNFKFILIILLSLKFKHGDDCKLSYITYDTLENITFRKKKWFMKASGLSSS